MLTSLPTLPLDAKTAWLTAGLLYVVMPIALWSLLHGRYDARNTALWCVGAALSGVSTLLLGTPQLFPTSQLALPAAAFVTYLSYGLRWAALRREQERPPRLGAIAAVSLAGGAVLLVMSLYGRPERFTLHLFANAAAAWLVAAQAIDLGRLRDSRSARMVGWTYVLLCGAFVVRAASVALGWGEAPPMAGTGDAFVVLLAGLVAALWGNLGYLGFAMESAQRRASARTAELTAATARSEQAERQAQALKAVSEERQELLHVISHEVRQPLHNAQAVLQSVDRALQQEQADAEGAAARITRARSVLGQIAASLDNVLAASTLLVGGRPTALRDTDIDMLVDLSLGDLEPAARSRVQVVRQAGVRTAAMDVGLMRLALRNLLNNALAYTAAESAVTLRVADSDEPLAVTFEVADQGPGIAPDLLPQLFERGTRGRHDQPGQGLGLYIVHLALRRQGGSVAVRSSADGTVFTLTLPQGQEEA